MRWTAKETIAYEDSKEYIDTVIIPLIPLDFGVRLKQSGNNHEFIQLITSNLENQFKGRVLLLPPLTYFSDSNEEAKQAILEQWVNRLTEEGFKHLFFISTDENWRRIQREIDMEFLEFVWLPSIPLQHLDEKNKLSIIQDQVQQLLNLFVSKWKQEEV